MVQVSITAFTGELSNFTDIFSAALGHSLFGLTDIYDSEGRCRCKFIAPALKRAARKMRTKKFQADHDAQCCEAAAAEFDALVDQCQATPDGSISIWGH